MGIREVTAFGASCPQGVIMDSAMNLPSQTFTAQDEDCLVSATSVSMVQC
jgi:hypothetical protein